MKKIYITIPLLIIIFTVGLLGAKAILELKTFKGDKLTEVEVTTERLVGIINRLDDDLKNNNKNLADARAQLAELTSDYNTKVQELTEMTDKYDQVTSELETLQSKYDAEVAGEEGTAHRETLDLLQAEIDAHTLTKKDLEDEIKAHNKTVRDMQDIIDSKKDTITTLTNTINTLKAEKITLQAKYDKDVKLLNNEIQEANDAVERHQLSVCTKLELLPYEYRLEFKEQCSSLTLFDITTETSIGALKTSYGEFMLNDFSKTNDTSLYLGTNISKTSDRVDIDYNNWSVTQDIMFTYEGSTGLMNLSINGVEQLSYTGDIYDMLLLDSIKISLTESSNAGFENGELVIYDITLNGDTDKNSFSVKDNTITLNFIGKLKDINDNVSLSFKLDLLGNMDNGENTKLEFFIGENK